MNFVVVETRARDKQSLDIAAFLFLMDAKALINTLESRDALDEFYYFVRDSRTDEIVPIS